MGGRHDTADGIYPREIHRLHGGVSVRVLVLWGWVGTGILFRLKALH